MGVPETKEDQPNNAGLPTGGWLVTLRLLSFVGMLLCLGALFGDFVVWGVKGTQYALSPNFARIETKIGVISETVLTIIFTCFVQGDIKKQYRSFFVWLFAVLLSVIVFLVFAAMPLAQLILIFIRRFAGSLLHIARFSAAAAAHPGILLWLLLSVLVLSLIFACKCYVVTQMWKHVRPLFKRQPVRRFVIGSE